MATRKRTKAAVRQLPVIAAGRNNQSLDYSFEIGGRTFEAVSFFDAEHGNYDLGTKYLVLVGPVLDKLISIGAMTELARMGVVPPQEVEQVVNLATTLQTIGDALPELVAISCQLTDPTITTEWVKANTKLLTHPALIRAVLLQLKKDEVVKRFMEMQNEINELAEELSAAGGIM